MPRPPKKPPGSPRGPAPSTDEGARNKLPRVSVPMTTEETAHLDAARKRLGLSRAEFMRRAVRAYAAISIGDLAIPDSTVISGDGIVPLTWTALDLSTGKDAVRHSMRLFLTGEPAPRDYDIISARSGDAWVARVVGVDGSDALGATEDAALQEAAARAYGVLAGRRHA